MTGITGVTGFTEITGITGFTGITGKSEKVCVTHSLTDNFKSRDASASKKKSFLGGERKTHRDGIPLHGEIG